jgi:nitroreductase
MNETLAVISKRFSCRDFAGKMPPDEDLRAIAAAAIAAPSANNSQRWKIIVVKNKALIGELEAEAMKSIAELPDKTLYNNFEPQGVTLFYHAPCVVFIAIEPSALVSASLDCGIVSQNIALAAESLGLASCICGLARFAFSENKGAYFREKLGFPQGYDFGMSVLLGIAKTPGTPHAPDVSKISFIE